ncbi:VWFA and cache domain-containing protein 1-like [Montipora capricornis]|uniref:VWFA and cache domain-containing protein 1-like n=1 Tax=Montipora capricornis TaxID=246305 RepID=UPI0035F1201D
MAEYLRIFVLFLFLTFTLQDDSAKPRKESATVDYNDLIGTFDDDLRNDLGNLAIGTKSFQEQVGKERDNMVSEGGYLDNSKIIKELNTKFSMRLNDMVHALHGVVTEVVKSLNSGKKATEEYHECCYLPKRVKRRYDRRFKDNVTFDVFCQRRVPSADLNEFQPDFKKLKTVFDENMKKTTLKVKWQYFGSSGGVFTIYPAPKVSSCDGYDHRLRPWYNGAAVSEPKNIIILLDSSTSMANYLRRAKEMTKIVLGTLVPKDKVSVIAFNASTYVPGDEECYRSSMASAKVFNINAFKTFVDRANPSGGTRYIRAFKKAFAIQKHTLRNSSENLESRPSMFLLITDDGPKKKHFQQLVIDALKQEFKEFRKEFKETDLKLIVLSFGRKMAFLDKLADVTGGVTASIAGKTDYYSRLQPYFDHLMKVTPALERRVVLSRPYVDLLGLGYMVTATCAVMDNEKKFRGVVGLDILMPDLVSNVQYFGHGTLQSYAFMFQSYDGAVLSHPNIPSPEHVTEESNAVHILQLEESEEFKELYQDVRQAALNKKVETFSKTINSQRRSIAAGGVLGEGINIEVVDYEYTCQPLETDNREFITCVAIKLKESDDKYGSSRILDNAGNHPTAYHRMDVLPEAKTCYHTDTVSYPDRSAVKLSAKAFVDPAEYFEEQDRLEAVRLYSKQLLGETQSVRIREGEVYAMKQNMPIVAILTSYFDRMVWGSGSAKFKRYTARFVRRFVGTYNGVLRVFPAAPLPTNFDHLTRPWFINAVANDGDTTLTHPYLDPLGAGFVVTVSHTITRDLLDPSLSNDHKIFAVVGGDLTISSLGASMAKTMGKHCVFKEELRCFLMDTRGYIVYHPDFEDAYNDTSKVVNRHITDMDGEIARDLIKNGVMKRYECRNLQLLKLQRFYEVNIEGETYKGDHGACDAYTVVRIPRTNVFVIRVKSKPCLINRERCPCSGVCENKDCECPCNAPLEYDICKAQLMGGHDIPLCGQPSPAVAPRPPLPGHPKDLGRCINTKCANYDSKLDCNEQFGCAWCITNFTTNRLLENPSCRRSLDCYGGALGRKNPFLLPYRPRKIKKISTDIKVLGVNFTRKSLTITGVSVGVGGLFLVILMWWYCKRKEQWELDFDEMFGDTDVIDQRMSTMHMGQRTSTMQMTQRQSAMHMGQRQSAMHMGQRQSAMQLGQRPSALQMGQRQSNMQMMMNNPGMQFSSDAMSGMWSTQGYGGQSQMTMAGNRKVSFNY